MFWKKQKNSTQDSNGNDKKTKVETTTAESQTTNTSVKNATIFNSNSNTVTFKTTQTTVTHTQQARITEMVSRRTPTLDELEEMLRTMNMNKGESAQRRSGNFAGRGSGNFTNAGGSGSGISAKSAPKFKSSVDTSTGPVKRLIFTYDTTTNNRKSGDMTPKTPKTPTVFKIQEVSYSQKSGSSMTSKMETQRIKLKGKFAYPTSSTSTSTDARPLLALPEITPVNKSTTYSSPFLNKAQYTAPTTTKTQRNYIPAYSSSLFNKPATTTKSATAATTTKPIFTSLYNPTKTSTTTTTTTTKPIFTSLYNPIKNNASPIIVTKSGKKSNLKPGCAYIFNNERFDDPKNERRIGSVEDVKLLRQTFEMFKLKVEVIENATLDKLRSIINKIQTKDFAKHSCIVIVIMSHGTRFEEVAAKDGSYSIDDDILFPILRNPTLIEKPKLLFIQACKGAMEAGGFKKDAVVPHGTPSEILKCYSTFEGYVSYRSEEGSIFIQAFCESLQLFGGIKNIKEIMETVTLLVKQQSENRQIPTITSTLTKPYVFGDYV